MLFSSTVFLFLFLPLVLVLYFISPNKLKNYVLLLASLFFYAWGEPKFLVIMLLSIIMNYFFGLAVDKNRDNRKKITWIMAIMIISNLALLSIFKYSNFVVDNMNDLLGTNIGIPMIPLPIGISFFTFQAMSYVIDVYRKNGKVQKNPLNLALYISLFPQLIAGPIVRYKTVADQIMKRYHTSEKFASGVKRFIIGLAKKMIIANNVGLIADQIFAQAPGEISVGAAWIGIIAYSLQIYFDFSAYSDMAIGLGRMFGFEFLENFNYPYISRSIAEFWRRWHISLGSWFRDYLYIPLGGNRKGELFTYRNLLIVWLATGIWHGASWNFIVWGLYYGFFIMLERAFLGKVLVKLNVVVQHMYALIIVVIGWVFFRADSLDHALEYLQTMFYINEVNLWGADASLYITENNILLVTAIIAATPVFKYVTSKLRLLSSKGGIVVPVALSTVKMVFYLIILMISVSFMVSNSFNPFIYFRF